MIAVTFDFGQTLAEIDFEFLARRVAEQGAVLDPARAEASVEAAWTAYGAAKSTGHENAWCVMMHTLLERAGIREQAGQLEQSAFARSIAAWLWAEQPKANLWRKPIAGMFELVAELGKRDVPVGIISNSEGKLAELVTE